LSTTNVFVFGTLRPGDYNHDRFGGIKEVIRNVTVPGRLYHAIPNRGRIYPGARFDEEGTIIGDILVYESGCNELEHVVRMEIGAGYSIFPVTATTEDGESILCIAFQYERPHGALIPSGDWFAADAYESRDLSDFAEDEYGEDWEDEWDEEDD
jgi:gamma-glutamylcyclotransferase (GGCT)/AIG2-like uncharacterized protein YtfP